MSEQSHAYYQRVVCIGLRRATKDTALIRSGFLYWNKQLADTDFDVSLVANQLVEYLGFGVNEKKALMLTFHAACNKLLDELPAVPQVLLDMASQQVHSEPSQNEPSPADKIVATKPACVLTTEAFLVSLMSFLGKYDAEELAELSRILRNEGLVDIDTSVSRVLQGWAERGLTALQLPQDTDESTCKDIAHALYLLMAEIIGPVIADRLVNKAIDHTLSIASAARFSPRELL
ncbi:hypothetical protein ACVBE9_07215 [Eionea flava]